MKALLLLACIMGVAATARADAGGARFSQTLSSAERVQVSLDHLTSDQVAVLDALIRHDMDAKTAGRAENSPAAFSQRLTPDERRNSGVAALAAPQVAALDALVERHEAAGLARSLLAPPVYISRGPPIETRGAAAERELHGSFSLSYGWGGGYSERTGAMTVRMDDPEHRYSITVGYAETKVKGPGY